MDFLCPHATLFHLYLLHFYFTIYNQVKSGDYAVISFEELKSEKNAVTSDEIGRAHV